MIRSFPARARRIAALVLGLTAAAAPARALAQVGHAPEHTPYRDIRSGHTFTVTGGYFGGGGGRFGIGPHDGQVYGLRYDIRSAAPVQFGLGFYRGSLDRLIVNPFVELVNRVSGPVSQTVSFAEANLQLNLTGGKSWNRLAPFLGTSVGLTFPSGTPADTSRFELGRKIYLAPNAGFRFFLTNRIHLRAEARAFFVKLKYPTTFQNEPVLQPGTPPDNSNAVITDGRLTEWTSSSWFQVGIGYSFSP